MTGGASRGVTDGGCSASPKPLWEWKISNGPASVHPSTALPLTGGHTYSDMLSSRIAEKRSSAVVDGDHGMEMLAGRTLGRLCVLEDGPLRKGRPLEPSALKSVPSDWWLGCSWPSLSVGYWAGALLLWWELVAVEETGGIGGWEGLEELKSWALPWEGCWEGTRNCGWPCWDGCTTGLW